MNTRRKSRNYASNANYRVPESLTSLAFQGVQALRKNPRTEYLQSEIGRKFVSRDTDPAHLRELRAINKWLAVDRENEATNTRLINYPGYHHILPGTTRVTFEATVRHFIESIIGDLPPPGALFGGFSGGASTSKKKGESFPSVKYFGQAHVTEPALPLWFDHVVDEAPLWGDVVLQGNLEIWTIPGNVMFTVPKSTEIDRCACKEPDLNMYLQRGLGIAIRRALARVGISLNDQSVNQRLARQGSIDGSLATLDLSSASDSVSYELVARFLPPLWFTYLDAARSQETKIKGLGWYRPHMFSSMGNGFTFELESLLFYALARASAYHLGVRGRISVFGDDIIVPTEMAEYLTYVLQFYGFSINTEKSFWTGSFRESCGGHFISGTDVSPFYIREPIARVRDLILFLNNLRLWDTRHGIGYETEPLWRELSQHVDPRLFGGHDPSYDRALVSACRTGGWTLEPKKFSLKDDYGSYLMWLDSRHDYSGPPNSREMENIVELESYRLRKRPKWSIRQTEHLYYGDVL